MANCFFFFVLISVVNFFKEFYDLSLEVNTSVKSGTLGADLEKNINVSSSKLQRLARLLLLSVLLLSGCHIRYQILYGSLERNVQWSRQKRRDG